MSWLLLSSVMDIAKGFMCNPADILSSSIDDFITILNYFTMKEDKEIDRKIAAYGYTPNKRDNFITLL